MTRQGPRSSLMRLGIRAAPTALDSRPCSITSNYDLSFTELQAAYWREIGVDVDIVVEEPAI